MIEELIRKHKGDRVAAAAELARGLMRGNRAELKLGYSHKNAAAVAISSMKLEDEADPKLAVLAVELHALGFAAGMSGATLESWQAERNALAAKSPVLATFFEDGFVRGAGEDGNLIYPAGNVSPPPES